jgi:hypothetical protein
VRHARQGALCDSDRSPMDAALDRLVALVRRDLGAEDVRVVASVPPSAPNVLVARLSDGRHLVASFSEVPADHDALARRLDMLASTFAGALDEADHGHHSRHSLHSSLHEELRALAQRAQAVDAFVIDAQSPVTWGSALLRPRTGPAKHVLAEVSQHKLIDFPEWPDEASDVSLYDTKSEDRGSGPSLEGSRDEAELLVLSEKTAARVRELAIEAEVQKGKHLRHVEASATTGHFAVSFSGIYVLVLTYTGAFDELRAERASHEALPRIEPLVLALPPLDPEPQPMGGVVAFRRGPRR